MEQLRLHSPVGVGREFDLVYKWPTDDNEKCTEEHLAEEIRESISAVLPDHPDLPFRIPPIKDLGTYDQLQDLCHKWNFSVDEYVAGKSFVENKASLPQAQHIIGQVYNKSVVYPERLNQYKAFSSHVYGETSPKMVSHMIEQLDITQDDIFLDLGSGVGQVVLQMAAAANAKLCIGIETCEVPCEYAYELEKEFQKTMKWYGKYYSKFHLYKGDFLDKPYRDVILKSTIIFSNNFAFGPEVNHHLKEIFGDLDDGVRIVSSKEFSAINFRINQRTLSDIGSIMHVSAMKPFEGAVSWTNSKVCFFMHVIDRTKLARWFEDSKQQQTLAVDKQKRNPTKMPDCKPPRKKPRAKFVMKKKRRDDQVNVVHESEEGIDEFNGPPTRDLSQIDLPEPIEEIKKQEVVRKQRLVHDQAILSMQGTSLTGEISDLTNRIEQVKKYTMLPDIYKPMTTKRSLGEEISNVTGALHKIEGKTPPSIPDSSNSDCEFYGEKATLMVYPSRLYVNEVRTGFDNQGMLKTTVYAPPPAPPSLAPAPGVNGTNSSYKNPQSSILPKKRRQF